MQAHVEAAMQAVNYQAMAQVVMMRERMEKCFRTAVEAAAVLVATAAVVAFCYLVALFF